MLYIGFPLIIWYYFGASRSTPKASKNDITVVGHTTVKSSPINYHPAPLWGPGYPPWGAGA